MKIQRINPQQLNQLFALINSGQPQTALAEIHRLLAHSPSEPNLLHLAGIASAALGNNAEALSYFRKSLKSAPNQPAALNNMANLLKKMGESRQASQTFEKAIALAPKFVDALLGLANLKYEQNAFGMSRELATSALDISNDNILALTLLGNIHRKCEEYSEAIQHFQQALSLDSEHVPAIYGLASTYSEMSLNDNALALLQKAHQLKPETHEILYSLALAQLRLNRFEQAERTLKSLITLSPQHVEAHKTLNEIYWQQGKQNDFCASYRTAMVNSPKHIPLTIAYIENLLAAGEHEEAERTLNNYWKDSSNPNIQYLRARLAEARNELREALALYSNAHTQLETLDTAKQLIITQIKSQHFEPAQQLLQKYLKLFPSDQLLWALQGTCWKMTADDRYEWLTQGNAFIREYTIPAPKGFSNLEEFLGQLKTCLLDMHNLENQPLNQSVRKGIQTPGRLLHQPNPLIQNLKVSFTEVVSEYIGSMPKNSAHPLLSRSSDDFIFSGSWSVLLKEGGHHVSHVHPAGWISSAFYVTVPSRNSVTTMESGDIYFGQSPYQLGHKDEIERYFAPSAGKLVLFPSFTWHGTVPITSSRSGPYRITTPFDVIPKGIGKG